MTRPWFQAFGAQLGTMPHLRCLRLNLNCHRLSDQTLAVYLLRPLTDTKAPLTDVTLRLWGNEVGMLCNHQLGDLVGRLDALRLFLDGRDVDVPVLSQLLNHGRTSLRILTLDVIHPVLVHAPRLMVGARTRLRHLCLTLNHAITFACGPNINRFLAWLVHQEGLEHLDVALSGTALSERAATRLVRTIGDLPRLTTVRLGLGCDTLVVHLPSVLDALAPAKRLVHLSLCLGNGNGEVRRSVVGPGFVCALERILSRLPRLVRDVRSVPMPRQRPPGTVAARAPGRIRCTGTTGTPACRTQTRLSSDPAPVKSPFPLACACMCVCAPGVRGWGRGAPSLLSDPYHRATQSHRMLRHLIFADCATLSADRPYTQPSPDGRRLVHPGYLCGPDRFCRNGKKRGNRSVAGMSYGIYPLCVHEDRTGTHLIFRRVAHPSDVKDRQRRTTDAVEALASLPSVGRTQNDGRSLSVVLMDTTPNSPTGTESCTWRRTTRSRGRSTIPGRCISSV